MGAFLVCNPTMNSNLGPLGLALLNAFFSGRKLTMEEALELKDLIDQHTWED